MPFQLNPFLAEFPAVCRAKFGRRYDFAKLEAGFSFLADGQRPLQGRDIVRLLEGDNTPFARYWNPPPEKEVVAELKKKPIVLGPMQSLNRLEVVRLLLRVLKSTSLASILLRFVHPQHFGIISSPVLHLLQVNRANTAELYLAYCEELEEWRRHFRMDSVAATDMALWAFYQLTEGGLKHAESNLMARTFEQDVWIQQRRVRSVLSPFRQRYGTLQFAKILALEDPNLAGKVAGEEYERLLRAKAKIEYPGFQFTEGWARRLISQLARDGKILLEQKTDLDAVWTIRNDSVHATSVPSTVEVELMVDRIERICAGWQSTRKTEIRDD